MVHATFMSLSLTLFILSHSIPFHSQGRIRVITDVNTVFIANEVFSILSMVTEDGTYVEYVVRSLEVTKRPPNGKGN